MKKMLLAAAAIVGLSAGAANAGLLTLTPGPDAGSPTFGTIPGVGTNQALPLFGIPASGDGYGYFGATVTGTVGASYKFEVFGAEASFRNKFVVGATTIYTHGGGNNLSLTVKASTTSNSLVFSFVTGAAVPVTVANGANPDDTITTAGPNFFASFDLKDSSSATNPLTGDVLWLFLDDGSTVDDNHDDLLVRITATLAPVPEPASLALLGAGLLGLGVAARRRRKA